MGNARLNITVGNRYSALRAHLRGFPGCAGERIKLLATIGVVCGGGAVPDGAMAHKEVAPSLRVNPRLSDAYPEVAAALSKGQVRAQRMMDLATLGLYILQHDLALSPGTDAEQPVALPAKELDLVSMADTFLETTSPSFFKGYW